MTIGERVKLRRQQLGLTQQELAKRLGNSSRASVCTIEKDREDLTTTRISKLAVALNTSESYLMGWTSDPNPVVINEDNSDKPTKIVKVVSQSLREYANDDTEEAYYTNNETAEMAQSLFENEDMRLLFDAAKDSRPEDLKMAADLLKRLKSTNPEG